MPSNLSIGCSGPRVTELQAALNFHIRKPATPLKPDGKFGPLTDARVREFQRLAKIKVDGIAGPQTAEALSRRVVGTLDVQVKPKETEQRTKPNRYSVFGPLGTPRLQLAPIAPLQVNNGLPDKPTPSAPQTKQASSDGWELKSRFTFDPLAKPSKGTHPFALSLSLELPWPVFLPEPLKLDIDTSLDPNGHHDLAAKIKIPFKIHKKNDYVEFKPYFSVGAGIEQYHFSDVNAAAGASLRVFIFRDLLIPGSTLGVEADGGAKYKHSLEKNEGELKGFFTGGIFYEAPLPRFLQF
jgi:hypothetical protein